MAGPGIKTLFQESRRQMLTKFKNLAFISNAVPETHFIIDSFQHNSTESILAMVVLAKRYFEISLILFDE
uniref:Uncharacterized protein n=1 Tax=Romanomermis culicivorax TaxID=13658 RepID=A0A915I9U0_ROMCU